MRNSEPNGTEIAQVSLSNVATGAQVLDAESKPLVLDPDALSKTLLKLAPEWTDEDVDYFINAMRAERVAVNAAEAAGKSKPRSQLKEADSKALAAKLRFEDLNIKAE